MPSSGTAGPGSGATRADPSLTSICRVPGRQPGAELGVRYTRPPPLGSGQVVRQLILDQPIRGSNPLSPANPNFQFDSGVFGCVRPVDNSTARHALNRC